MNIEQRVLYYSSRGYILRSVCFSLAMSDLVRVLQESISIPNKRYVTHLRARKKTMSRLVTVMEV